MSFAQPAKQHPVPATQSPHNLQQGRPVQLHDPLTEENASSHSAVFQATMAFDRWLEGAPPVPQEKIQEMGDRYVDEWLFHHGFLKSRVQDGQQLQASNTLMNNNHQEPAAGALDNQYQYQPGMPHGGDHPGCPEMNGYGAGHPVQDQQYAAHMVPRSIRQPHNGMPYESREPKKEMVPMNAGPGGAYEA